MKAFLAVDLQNDFMPGGALAVKEGNLVLPVINKLLKLPFDAVIASKDWHPKDHASFARSHNKAPGDHIMLEGLDQILWPEHCVQNTPGSRISSRFGYQQSRKGCL